LPAHFLEVLFLLNDSDRIPAMQIRSITCFIDPRFSSLETALKIAGDFLKVARPAFTCSGYEVQSARLATVPFASLLDEATPHALVSLAQYLEHAIAQLGFEYISLGPALPTQMDYYQLIPETLSKTQNTFLAGSLTTQDGEVSLSAIHQCARVIQQAGTISSDGFANLRFAALANVPPGSPFFPAAYCHGGEPSFALATEAADLAVTSFTEADSLQAARQNLICLMEEHGHRLSVVAQEVEKATSIHFGGIDFSLAPFPAVERSLGTAMERLGVPTLGVHGSLAAAAILADTIDQAKFNRAGFSGLLLPVLEDATLALRAAQGSLDLTHLLLFSAVCGTGLDTIPLPGDATEEQLAAILLDLASLSSRLAKPLTARLMPIPGKKPGDPTGFNFSYFANSRVLPIHAVSLNRFLSGNETVSLKPRKIR
jgi:uncharacterized protein (UPF0210 family)